ncbi:MAG: hypothetical protein AAGC77_04385 [Pseudomonadota bacterium]
MSRPLGILIIVVGFGVFAYVSMYVLGGADGEKSCADGYVLEKTNPPIRMPRYKCMPEAPE